MSEAHQKIIRDNRKFLVESIDVINTSLLDHLVQHGVLSVQQLISIKDTCSTNMLRVSALLDHLHRRTKEDWGIFMNCLYANSHRHVVTRLETSGTAGCSESEVIDLQYKMATLIKDFYDNIPLWTLHSDRVTIPMDDIYVSLVMVKENQRKNRKEEKLHSYKDILRKEADRRIIYMTGEPGVGKSTLVKRICVDWAVLKKEKEQTGGDETLSHYLFVLPIFLRDIKVGQTFSQVLENEYQLRENEAEALCRCIEHTDNPILIILDGLDEYNEDTSTEITEIIKRRRLPHITLFITSRFLPESIFCDDKPGRCVEVRLQGFSEAGVKEYVERYFDDQKDEKDALLQEIKKSEELEHFSQIPAILLMMVTLWEENQQLPSTITTFYEEFVAYVFARMEKKIKRVTDRAKSTKEILKRYNTQIMALGCLATGHVKTHKLELNFKHQDVIEHISTDDINIGFLIEKQTFSREIFYIFVHKTVQEYFLAFYLVFSDKSKQKELLLRFFNSRRAFTDSGMILRFVVGLGGYQIQNRIKALIDGDKWEVAQMHTELQLEYLAEHQDSRLTLPHVVNLYIGDRYPKSHIVRYLSQPGGEVRAMSIGSIQVNNLKLLQHLDAPHLTSLDLWGVEWPAGFVRKTFIGQSLDRTLPKFPLKQLTARSLLYGNIAFMVVRGVVYSTMLQDLKFKMTPLTGDLMQTLTAWLPGSHLQSLALSQCHLTLQETITTFSVLPPSLRTLDVGGNKLTGLTKRKQLSGVTSSHIETLYMSKCRLTPCGVLAVIDSAPSTLTYLDMNGNCPKGGDDLISLTEMSKQLSKLKTLNLVKNHLRCDVVMIIKQKLTETLPHLDLVIEGEPDTDSDGSGQTDSDESGQTDSDESGQTDTDSDESGQTDKTDNDQSVHTEAGHVLSEGTGTSNDQSLQVDRQEDPGVPETKKKRLV